MVIARLPSFSDSVKVITALGSFFVKPDLIGGVKAGGTLYEVALKLAKAPPKSLGKIGAEIEALADETFAAMHGEVPEDARRIFVQMVEVATLDAEGAIGCDLDARKIVDRMLASMTDARFRQPGMQKLFRQIAEPALARVLTEPVVTADLTPAVFSEILKRMTRTETLLEDLSTRHGSLFAALDALKTARRDELEVLATRFGIPEAFDRGDDELRELLFETAEDVRSMKARLQRLLDADARLDNLMPRAQEAIEDGRFELADELLAEAEELHLEAKTLEPVRQQARFRVERGNAALLKGDVERAAERFLEGAEMLGPFAAEEAGALAYTGGADLWRYAMRFGGTGLALADTLYSAAQIHWPRDQLAEKWAAAENAKAATLCEQGTRIGGAEGAALLGEAVAAYRAALEVRTRVAMPEQWAATQNNLGNALRDQGNRIGDAEGAALLGEAVAAYSAALDVYTRAAMPADWAMTQNNLGTALSDQGTRIGGAEGAALLGEAVDAYRAALEVRTRAAMPVDWAITQNNLGVALGDQGTRIGGAEGATLLGEAVDAYRAALEVHTREPMPVQWAATQNNLGTALGDQGIRIGGPEGAALLSKAVDVFRAALEVRTREAMPVDWAMTQNNLGLLFEAWAGMETEAAEGHLREALACFDLALEVYDAETTPYDFGTATTARARVLAALDEAGGGVAGS